VFNKLMAKYKFLHSNLNFGVLEFCLAIYHCLEVIKIIFSLNTPSSRESMFQYIFYSEFHQEKN